MNVFSETVKFYLKISEFRINSFSAQWPSDREVQLPDSDSHRTGRVKNGRCGLGQADRTSAAQNKTRPLSHVLPRWAATTCGGDGEKTQQVKVLHYTNCQTHLQQHGFIHFNCLYWTCLVVSGFCTSANTSVYHLKTCQFKTLFNLTKVVKLLIW